MARVVHIGAVDPNKGHGGVEQFARDLRDSWSGETLFLAYHSEDLPPWELAKRNNRLNLGAGVILPDDIVVADGYYGLGLAEKVGRLIAVCHGSYAGMLREYSINPPPGLSSGLRGFLRAAEAQQYHAYMTSEVVAVSDSAAYDLFDIYGISGVKVIRNGIDIEKYQPTESEEGWVDVAGRDERKGSDVVRDLLTTGLEISQLGFDGEKEERWRKFRYAILPSRYEGGQYAALEAMACNLTIVAYRSGFFDVDISSKYVHGTYDYYFQNFASLMKKAENSPHLNPRDWVAENATIQQFQEGWRAFLNEDTSGGAEDSA